uniref:Uncharacterized protein n=1 Tax=Alexandrium monilatum TaxID=311494 RepID=A0A7S4PU78_9DINO
MHDPLHLLANPRQSLSATPNLLLRLAVVRHPLRLLRDPPHLLVDPESPCATQNLHLAVDLRHPLRDPLYLLVDPQSLNPHNLLLRLAVDLLHFLVGSRHSLSAPPNLLHLAVVQRHPLRLHLVNPRQSLNVPNLLHLAMDLWHPLRLHDLLHLLVNRRQSLNEPPSLSEIPRSE